MCCHNIKGVIYNDNLYGAQKANCLLVILDLSEELAEKPSVVGLSLF